MPNPIEKVEKNPIKGKNEANKEQGKKANNWRNILTQITGEDSLSDSNSEDTMIIKISSDGEEEEIDDESKDSQKEVSFQNNVIHN